ncbi:dihydroorotate dehydrogenase [Nocardioides sp. JQ2195]|uniref:nitronate monooxygenase n=1 Tax=Nocardioides sp. JQ2195 TaxID=2592334 RepID=UPI00143EE486|nr:nitronate monooxygenase [Nocardioides sp. JQ2195]QIX26876.1 dihydroorotate dehydrogenase [Nocardioides sp. JQ2195]
MNLGNPVMIASGCGGTGRELDGLGVLDAVGAFVTRTITLDSRVGGAAPRVAESPSGLVHAIGLQNPGIDQFLTRELPWLAARKVPTHVSIAGATLGEHVDLARRLGQSPGVSGIEVNLSAPDASVWGLFDAQEPFQAARVVAAVRRDLPRGIAVHAKLAPDLSRVVEAARAVVEAGADAVVLVNAAPALLADGRTGGLSGPAIRPLALRCVHEVHSALTDLPVIGAGGIVETSDAREFLAAGAAAVQIGTALLHDPTTAARIAADLGGETP